MDDRYLFGLLAFSLLASVPVRSLLVFRIRRARPDLWKQFGAPHPLMRDHFFSKYPYAGWSTAFRELGLTDKLLLVLHAVIHILAVIALLAIVFS